MKGSVTLKHQNNEYKESMMTGSIDLHIDLQFIIVRTKVERRMLVQYVLHSNNAGAVADNDVIRHTPAPQPSGH